MTDAPAARTKTLDVTQDDIDHGRRGSSRNCPFVLAAKRLFGTDRISAVPRAILVREGPGRGGWLTDEAGFQVIRHYDKTGEMQPGQYPLTRRVTST